MGIQLGIEVDPIDTSALFNIVREQFQEILSEIAPLVKIKTKELIKKALEESKEYESLNSTDGELRRNFGLANQQEVVSAVVNAVLEDTHITILPGAGNNLGGLRIECLASDFSTVLSLPEAEYVSVNENAGTSILIPWLRWLLLEGERLIIADYKTFGDGRTFKQSRTRTMIMVKSNKGWRIPQQYTPANIENNWLSRSLLDSGVPDNLEEYIISLF